MALYYSIFSQSTISKVNRELKKKRMYSVGALDPTYDAASPKCKNIVF